MTPENPHPSEPDPLPRIKGVITPWIGRFGRHSIRAKLLIVILVSSLAALSCSTAIFMVFEGISSYRLMIQRTRTMAEVVASNTTAAVIFKDDQTATQILSAFSADRDIHYALLLLPNGNVIAEYHPNVNPRHSHPSPNLLTPVDYSLKSIGILVPVQADHETVAYLYLKRGLKEMRESALTALGAALLAALLGALLALLVSSRLQGIISDPILDLAITARQVSQKKDYSIRAVPKTEDETAILIRHFNEMLEQIQQRDESLQKARDDLEKRVEERTAELQKEIEERKRVEKKIRHLLWRIHEDNEKLHELNRMKNDFLANVSHELRTPLTSILGFLKLVVGGQGGPLTSTQADFINTSLANANRLYSLVNDLLDMSRLESGAMHIHPKAVPVEAFLKEIVQNVKSLLGDKVLSLSIHSPSKGCVFQADQDLFHRVLLNFLSNAIKFTPRGGAIEIGARETMREGREGMDFWVKDSGIGVPQGELEKIFDKFYQVESHLTRKVGGTGLGLAIAKRITEAHGGDIWVESSEGKGSTFHCFLPKDLPIAEDPPTGSSAPSPSSPVLIDIKDVG